MTQTLFRNFRMLDPERDELLGGCEILVEGETIREVSERPIRASDAAVVDCGGRTLMPGLIDCHAHVVLSEVFIRQLENVPLTLMTARAVVALKAMLERGFTTVRDTGGADWGLKAAVDQGLIEGPRLFISGRAIGPTGGHADARRRAGQAGGDAGEERAGDRWRVALAGDLQARWGAGGIWNGSARAAAGGAEPGVRVAGAGAVADGDHPVGDVGGGAGVAQGRQARVPGGGRLCRLARGGRESFEGHQRASVAGEVAARDHEGRAVLPESPALVFRAD